MLIGVLNWLILIAFCGEEGPGTVVEEVGVELAVALIETQGGTVDTQDVSYPRNYWQILETFGI